jgi:hypothetical protein
VPIDGWALRHAVGGKIHRDVRHRPTPARCRFVIAATIMPQSRRG